MTTKHTRRIPLGVDHHCEEGKGSTDECDRGWGVLSDGGREVSLRPKCRERGARLGGRWEGPVCRGQAGAEGGQMGGNTRRMLLTEVMKEHK